MIALFGLRATCRRFFIGRLVGRLDIGINGLLQLSQILDFAHLGSIQEEIDLSINKIRLDFSSVSSKNRILQKSNTQGNALECKSLGQPP